MNDDLTAKQRDVLTWIDAYVKKHQFPPSQRDVATGLGYSFQSGVQGHILALEKKGYLIREKLDGGRGMVRGLRVLKLPPMLTISDKRQVTPL